LEKIIEVLHESEPTQVYDETIYQNCGVLLRLSKKVSFRSFPS
jgi:hypothetical protein